MSKVAWLGASEEAARTSFSWPLEASLVWVRTTFGIDARLTLTGALFPNPRAQPHIVVGAVCRGIGPTLRIVSAGSPVAAEQSARVGVQAAFAVKAIPKWRRR